jgi:hypothetical protein
LSRALALAAALLVWAAARAAFADGGRLRASEDAGEFRIAIFTAPEPLFAGRADVSVLVQDRTSGEAVLDADVTLELLGPGGAESVVTAGRHARNRLFYGAEVELAPGAWIAAARVRRGASEAVVRAPFEVRDSRRAAVVWPYLSIPPCAVVLYAANRGLRNRSRKRRSG